MKTIGIISQARMTSTRLPGKVLKKVGSKTLLDYHLERLKKAELPVVIATTTNNSDDPILQLSQSHKLNCFRGDEHNVLSRFYFAAKESNFDIIVRVTSDCPLIDGELIKIALKKYLSSNQDWLYLSNCLRRTYPRGFDFEIFSFAMLKEAFDRASEQFEMEHVTPYLYQNKHGKTQFLSIEKELDDSRFRVTVDEPDDFKLIERLILEYNCDQLSADNICDILRAHPELSSINIHVEQKKI